MTLAAVDLHPDALLEIRAAAAFLAEVDSAIETVAEDPRRWPSAPHATRRYLLHRFPFTIVYRESVGTIQVIAVAHAKKRPDYWRAR